MVSVDTWTLRDRGVAQTPTLAGGMSVQILRGRAGLGAIGGEWRALHALSSAPEHVFLTASWIELWHDHYVGCQSASGDDPLILVTCRHEGHLALVWPLFEVKRLGLRLLKWAGEPVSQYGDVLVDRGRNANALLEAAWQAICSLGADALILRKTRSGCAAAEFLAGKGAFVSEREEAPFIDLAGIDCPLIQAKHYPAKDRKNRRRHRKRLGERGDVHFEWLEPSAQASRLARIAVDLKRDWLTRSGRISKAFTDRRIEDFLADALSGADPDLDGRVGVIHCGEKPAAILVGFLNKGYYAGFLTSYDGTFERHSPGSLLFEDAIAAAIGEHLSRIDLLAPADAYKHDWASSQVGTEDLCLPLTVGGNIYARVVQSRMRHGLKAGIEAMTPAMRRAVLYVATLLPALLYATADP